MNNTIITAGVVAAAISGIVSLIITWFTQKNNRRKDRFDRFIPILAELQSSLGKIKSPPWSTVRTQEDLERIDHEMVESAHTAINLYLPKEAYIDEDLRKLPRKAIDDLDKFKITQNSLMSELKYPNDQEQLGKILEKKIQIYCNIPLVIVTAVGEQMLRETKRMKI